MARQVMFDPFGSYATGFNVGANQQQNIELNARKAREEDFNHQYLDPFKINAARRADTLGNALLPTQIAMAPIGLQEAREKLLSSQLGNASVVGQDTNNPVPFLDIAQKYYGVTQTPNAQGGYTLSHNINGVDIPFANVPQDYGQQVLNNLNFARNMDTSKLDAATANHNAMIQAQIARYYGALLSGLGSYARGTATHGAPQPNDAGGFGDPTKLLTPPTAQPAPNLNAPTAPGIPTPAGGLPPLDPYRMSN